ncbi:hypothetical protein [Microcoleus sp. herbarium12]|jgi:hypothetical protein|uniref:hypothetical protein n=1 Tax=Microcoleus sp. herbarium12 TaxID=3055437 RepID=UPI002FD6B39D
MATPVDFPKYLQFLVESYQEKKHLYTLTDLQVEVRVEISPQEKSPFPFLMNGCIWCKANMFVGAKHDRI